MKSQAQSILEFRRAAQQPIRSHPTVAIPREEKVLALDLILEELLELAESFGLGLSSVEDPSDGQLSWVDIDREPDVIAAADAFGDLMVVVGQLGPTLGMNADAIFEEVHSSNMSKVDPATGVMPLKPNGKAGKGPNFREPDMERALLATPIGESMDPTIDPDVDVVVGQSAGAGRKAVMVEYPHLAACRFIPAARWGRESGPIRDIYVMSGIDDSYPGWPERKQHLESVMADSGLGGKFFYL